MTLLHYVLRGTLYQTLTATKDTNIVAIRPHILRVGSPSGSLIIQLEDNDGLLIKASNAVSISTIGSDANFHGYVQFALAHPIKTGDTFRVTLTSTGGYSATESAYIGWVNGYDLGKYSATYVGEGDKSAPLDVEIWQKRTIGMVRELDFADGFESASAPSGSTEFTLTNNQASATDVTGLVFNFAEFQAAKIGYSILRSDGADDRRESGTLSLQYKPNESAWEIARESEGDTNVGVTFTVTASGQVQYTTDNFAGQTTGYLKYQINERYTPGA